MTDDEAIYTLEQLLNYRIKNIEMTDDLVDALHIALDALKGRSLDRWQQ